MYTGQFVWKTIFCHCFKESSEHSLGYERFLIRLIEFAVFTATLYSVTFVALPYFWNTEKWKSFDLYFLHQTIVLAAETSSEMASTLCQKQMTLF